GVLAVLEELGVELLELFVGDLVLGGDLAEGISGLDAHGLGDALEGVAAHAGLAGSLRDRIGLGSRGVGGRSNGCSRRIDGPRSTGISQLHHGRLLSSGERSRLPLIYLPSERFLR